MVYSLAVQSLLTVLASAAMLGTRAVAQTIPLAHEPASVPVPDSIPIQARGQILSAVILARWGVLTDSTRISSCGIYRILGQRADYLNLLHPAVRRMVEVAAPTPCSPDPIWTDSTLFAQEKRRRLLAKRPSDVSFVSIEQRDGRYVVGLGVTRPGYGYGEYHTLGAVPAPGSDPLPWAVREIAVRTIIAF